jgi:outer membrane protein insertion porin family
MMSRTGFAVAATVLLAGTHARAQQGTPPPAVQGSPAPAQAPAQLPFATVCGQQVRPAAQPPDASGPVILYIAPCFEAQGGTSVIEPQTYLYYIQLKASAPSQGKWVPYDDTSDKVIEEDFRRLWGTNFLDNLSIEKTEYRFPNGVVGEIVTYNMEERQRVKIVDYVGSKQLETAKIDEKLKDAKAEIRLDTFIDPGLIRKVEGIVRDMMKEKGFQYAEVTHEIKEMPGGPKLVHVTFHMDEGPEVKIRKITFLGNKVVGDGTLKRKMKENKERWWLSFITGSGNYQEAKFDDDAAKLLEYYRDRGYIKANVGVPELKTLGDSSDKKTRWVELRIPITEGDRYSVGSFDFSGNTVVKSDALKPLFKVSVGEYYSEKAIRDGLEKARDLYGAGGYFEFTGFPDYKFRDEAGVAAPAAPQALAAPAAPAATDGGAPVVDVTMRLQEGQQYFVNRITFVGNTTTRDTVIRREMRLVEDGVFNTEALKTSVKRLNQLGYFKPLEGGKDVDVQKTPNEKNKVDVRLKLEEQNRNQISFGAGVSEFEGFFGQASFQTANFLGRGESLTVSLSAGSRAQNYSLGFTEPFLFDRNMTGGISVFRSDVRYISQFTQRTDGTTLTYGFATGGFSRMFINYSYQRVRVTEINAQYCNPAVLRSNPILRDSLLLSGTSCAGVTSNTPTTTIDATTGLPVGTTLVGGGQARIISKVTPSYVYNTVDQPIFPSQGQRYSLAIDLAGLGGNTNFYKPTLDGVWYWHQNNRLSLGMHGQLQYIRPFSGTQDIPLFEKLFLGGEYSIRGYDLRSIGPQDPVTGLVLGGNKSLLFNVEQNINIAGPVRLILFYDAGQVRDFGHNFSWKEDITTTVTPPFVAPILTDPLQSVGLFPPLTAGIQTLTTGQRSAFKTSTGAEVRFFMPVLNVPFRLIFAYNPQRGGVLDNQLQPQQAFQFRFAVGTTF